MRKAPIRVILPEALLLLCLAGMIVRLLAASQKEESTLAGVRQGNYHLHVPLTSGVIYDCHMQPLTQSEQICCAVVNPTPEASALLLAKTADPDAAAAGFQSRSPFLCRLIAPVQSSKDVTVLNGTENRPGSLPAQHLLGYIQNGRAASGLEHAYEPWLRSCSTAADITFTVDANGMLLAGGEQNQILSGAPGGIVTTLDAEIQQIAEDCLQSAAPHAGAVVVLRCGTGEIAACASSPVYDPAHLADALNRKDAPFLNRALSAYSVGSVFKLVTAATALEHGSGKKFMYDCTGEISVKGKRFRCHKLAGHGLLDMQNALIQSCNPYFISLSRMVTPEMLHDTAEQLGFGTATEIADSYCGSAGYLPSAQELHIEAEKANFSFGQGKLLATPLQIAAMTACIADDGIYTAPYLVSGLTPDGTQLVQETEPVQRRVLSKETASSLRWMMNAVLEKSKTTKGKPTGVRAAGKTSTAQTGRYSEDGTEYCHAWMTGFFPVYQPEYIVTVFIEDGGSGNTAAAPVFRNVIERILAARS